MLWCQYRLQRPVVISAQKLTQLDPHCVWAKDRLQEATREMQVIRQQHEEFLFKKSAAWWVGKGDKVNSEFFLNKVPKLRGMHIQHLKQEDDSMAANEEEILQMTTNYYKDLLAPVLTDNPPSNLMHDVVACLKTRIGEVAETQFSKAIEKEEIVAGLDRIHSLACPGADGLNSAQSLLRRVSGANFSKFGRRIARDVEIRKDAKQLQ